MKSRRFAWLGIAVLLAGGASATPASSVAATAKAGPSFCGPLGGPQELVEPPDIDVSKLPLNATGEHELILAVHTDGRGAAQRYCYRYEWGGSVRSVAPTLRVHPGEHFAVRIVNEIAGPSKGERVASTAIPACMPMPMPAPATNHYAGYLNHTLDDRYTTMAPVDTNLHLHGYEGPEREENVFLSTLSNPMRACEYHVTIPTTQPPGTYMYHPHSHGSSEIQVALGLDGVWVVEPQQPELPRSAEHVIMLRYRIPFVADDPYAPSADPEFIAAAHEGARPAGSPVPFDPFNPPPWPVTYPMSFAGVQLDASGCDGAGSDVLVALNGSAAPVSLDVPAGQTQLLRLVNGTSDTATALQMRDAAGKMVPIRLAALDGVPLSTDPQRPLSRYVASNEIMLTSMSRADILVTAAAGEKLTLSSEHYCMGADGFFEGHHDLVHVTAVPAVGSPPPPLDSKPAVIADTTAGRLVAYVRAHEASVRHRAFAFTEYAIPKNGKIPEHQAYFITETTNRDFHEHPFWPVYRAGADVPQNADVVVKRGTVEEWYLVNTTMEAHAFHIHQMAFVQQRSVPNTPMMADTVFVSVGKLLPNKRDPNYPLVQPRITKIILDFRHVPRGTFVFHCHMLFHEDRGMMGIIRVE